MPRRWFWLPEEDRIVARHARALVAGRYVTLRSAALACQQGLEAVRRKVKKTDPAHFIVHKKRSLTAVERRLNALLRKEGIVWDRLGLFEDERKEVQRHARALACGKYPNARRAAEDCWKAMKLLPPGRRRFRLRTFDTVHNLVRRAGRAMRRPWTGVRWSCEEDEILDRFARALARGEYSDCDQAVVACRSEMARRLGRAAARGRSLVAIRARLRRWAHTKGWTRFQIPWSNAEYAVMDRCVRALHEGRYANTESAARACVHDLRTLHARLAKRSSTRYALTQPRTFGAVFDEMKSRSADFHLPRFHARWTAAEVRIVEQYADGVEVGEFPSWRAAARECLCELRRLYAVAGKASPLRTGPLAGRGYQAVRSKMMQIAHEEFRK